MKTSACAISTRRMNSKLSPGRSPPSGTLRKRITESGPLVASEDRVRSRARGSLSPDGLCQCRRVHVRDHSIDGPGGISGCSSLVSMGSACSWGCKGKPRGTTDTRMSVLLSAADLASALVADENGDDTIKLLYSPSR